MAGRKGHARNILVALIGLLTAGIVAAVMMSFQAQSAAEDAAVQQAVKIADNSLSLVFEPADLTAPVSEGRAAALTESVSAIVLDPSEFTTVTVWSSGGVILYSTETGRISNVLAGERTRIRTAIRGTTQTRTSGGEFSVMVPLQTISGVTTDSAVELTRPDDQIVAAAGPWRTNALFLLVALLATIGAAWRVGHAQSALGTMPSFPRAAPAPAAIRPQPEPARRIEVPTPGLKEEGDARRLAETRAQAAEERLALLQEQYKKALEDLQTFQQMARESISRPDPRVEERALRAEGLVRTLERQVRALKEEREQLAVRVDELSARRATGTHEERRLLEAEQEAIGLRAELEGVQTQLSVTQRDLRTLKAQAGRSSDLAGDLASAQQEAREAADALAAAKAEAKASRAELDDLRTELRGLRNEEQRAAMLADELRAAKAELQGSMASHRAELVEREADLEDKVRAAREQFQAELADIESSYREQLNLKEQEYASRLSRLESQSSGADEELGTLQAELQKTRDELARTSQEAARAGERLARRDAEVEAIRVDLAGRDDHASAYLAELDGARAEIAVLREELATGEASLAGTQAELLAAQSGAADEGERARRLEHERHSLGDRADQLAQELEDAAAENAELNRKLQELEARRALELADDTDKGQIDDLLRVTQDRLAGQTEKLMAAEDRIHDLERDLETRGERLEDVEAKLRQHQMSDALREIREPHPDEAGEGVAIEDRRASSPFMKELSADARKSLSRINGITALLKHRKDGKDQSQLVKQLGAHLRRLDHTVADILDADNLARGTIELTVKRTNLEALVQRVVEETGVSADHDVRVEVESISIGVDPLRTEQIVTGLIRASNDRTPNGKAITVRLGQAEGGALISVEDPEPSSDASLSLVVRRFAEVQGGWAKVESRESGGSAFRVFLPDAAPHKQGSDVQVLVDGDGPEEEAWESENAQILVQELHRLAGE